MNIHQEVTINARPEEVYEVLLSSEKFEKMTGGRKARISREVAGASSMFGGDIQAINIELEPGRRVVQAWRSINWPEGVHSIVHFELRPEGKGTKLVFDQAGHPDKDTEMLSGGWQMMYWDPMNALLAA